jgi:hypothetical protein
MIKLYRIYVIKSAKKLNFYTHLIHDIRKLFINKLKYNKLIY